MDGNKDSNIADYYDTYTVDKGRTQKNLRHYKIIRELVTHGLKGSINVLEVGCGNGLLSELILKRIPKGKFVGVDISPKSIAIARHKFTQYPNAGFEVSDMLDFKHKLSFDYIVFADVLEHIPEDDHEQVFQNIDKVSHPQTKMFVNIPSPELNEYLRKNEPTKLQIIDQELNLGELISKAYATGFILNSFNRYSIFRKDEDYIKMWFRRNKVISFSERRNPFLIALDKYRTRVSLLQ